MDKSKIKEHLEGWSLKDVEFYSGVNGLCMRLYFSNDKVLEIEGQYDGDIDFNVLKLVKELRNL